jgi:uncharacterized DUF497 family protein
MRQHLSFREHFRRGNARSYPDCRATCEGVIRYVTYTESGERIRTISARRAERHEQDDYYRENAR